MEFNVTKAFLNLQIKKLHDFCHQCFIVTLNLENIFLKTTKYNIGVKPHIQ